MSKKYFLSSTVFSLSTLLFVPSAFAQHNAPMPLPSCSSDTCQVGGVSFGGVDFGNNNDIPNAVNPSTPLFGGKDFGSSASIPHPVNSSAPLVGGINFGGVDFGNSNGGVFGRPGQQGGGANIANPSQPMIGRINFGGNSFGIGDGGSISNGPLPIAIPTESAYISPKTNVQKELTSRHCTIDAPNCEIEVEHERKTTYFYQNNILERTTLRVSPNASFCPGETVRLSKEYNLLNNSVEQKASCDELTKPFFISPIAPSNTRYVGSSYKKNLSEDQSILEAKREVGRVSDTLNLRDVSLPAEVKLFIAASSKDKDYSLLDCEHISVNGVTAQSDSDRSCYVRMQVTDSSTTLKPTVSEDGLYAISWGTPEVIY